MKLALPRGHALVISEDCAKQLEFGPAGHDPGYLRIGNQDRFEYAESDDVYVVYGDDGTIHDCLHAVAEAEYPRELPLPASLALVDPQGLRRSAMSACMPIMNYADETQNPDIMADFQYLANVWGRLPYVYPHLNGRTGRETQDALVAKYLADRKSDLAAMTGAIGGTLGNLVS